MKHIFIIIALLVALSETSTAQTTKKTAKKASSTKARVDSTISDNTYSTPLPKGKSVSDNAKGKKILSNNRRIYHWKDGQRATPTGHEATGLGGGYAALGKERKPLARDTVSQKASVSDRAEGKKVLLNNRRIYHWKDGQRATPTGHEATGVGGGYAALGKDRKPLAKDTVPPNHKKPVNRKKDQR